MNADEQADQILLNSFGVTARFGSLIPAGPGDCNADGVMYPASKVPLMDITDGTSHTFLVGEISWNCGPQRI
jgi:hypothetical protein